MKRYLNTIFAYLTVFSCYLFLSSASTYAACSFADLPETTASPNITVTISNTKPNSPYTLIYTRSSNPTTFTSSDSPKTSTGTSLTFMINGLAFGTYTFKASTNGDSCVSDSLTVESTAPGATAWTKNAAGVCVESANGNFQTKEDCEREGNRTDAPQAPAATNAPPAPPCVGGFAAIERDGGCNETESAFGNLSTKPEEVILTLFQILLGMSGGIAVLIIIFAGYKYMTSQGNPEAVKGAQEMVVSAVAGLLFIIFSFVILQVIGQDILAIPGFN